MNKTFKKVLSVVLSLAMIAISVTAVSYTHLKKQSVSNKYLYLAP